MCAQVELAQRKSVNAAVLQNHSTHFPPGPVQGNDLPATLRFANTIHTTPSRIRAAPASSISLTCSSPRYQPSHNATTGLINVCVESTTGAEFLASQLKA